MITLNQILRNARAVNEQLVAIASLRETQDEMADKNRERMDDGIRADGSKMPIYSYISQTVYGYPNIPIRLHDTGDFQNAIHVSIKGDIIRTTSTDWKSAMLVERYGKEIFGLYGPYKAEYLREALKPAFVREMRRQLFKAA